MRRFYGPIVDEAGNIQVGAELYVRDQGDNSLVTLYSDDGSTTTANPVVSGSDGYVSFYTADNTLKLEIYIDGELEKTIEQYQHFDLDNITAAAWSILDDASVGDIRTTLGVGTGDSPQFTAINLGHASDTTITRVSAGVAAVEGSNILLASNISTAAEYRNDTASKLLQGAIVWDAAEPVALAESGGNVAVDMNSGINFTLAMTGNWTLSNPTNAKPGQSGYIQITQDATGSRTLAYGSEWKFAGGSDPVLSTAANSVDVLFYQVLSSGNIFANLIKAIA